VSYNPRFQALTVVFVLPLLVDEHAIVVPLETELELGFTFSFPVKQTAIDSGTLITWTKGFSCPHMVGKDPAAFLQDAFHRKNIPVRVGNVSGWQVVLVTGPFHCVCCCH